MPNWRELKRFCERDGWELGTGEISPRLWKDILKKQLQVDEAYFNRMI